MKNALIHPKCWIITNEPCLMLEPSHPNNWKKKSKNIMEWISKVKPLSKWRHLPRHLPASPTLKRLHILGFFYQTKIQFHFHLSISLVTTRHVWTHWEWIFLWQLCPFSITGHHKSYNCTTSLAPSRNFEQQPWLPFSIQIRTWKQ